MERGYGVKDVCDLTRPYHNLLGIQRGEEEESYYWDFTPIATERKNSPPRYYLADDLGSPLRVLYSTGKGECYGYDEFGRDLSLSEKVSSVKEFGIPYTKQGSSQPFGYIGYRYDGISGSYFAQAREYQPGTGRFMAEDVIRGRLAVPKMLNRYGYCNNNPLMFVDNDGKTSIGIRGISLIASEAEKELYSDLSDAVEGYANLGQYLKTAPFNNNFEAMQTLLKYDEEITAAADKHGIEKEMVQAVLFQEIRFYGADDVLADSVVMQAHTKVIREKYHLPQNPWTFIFAALGKTDSSTGLGQIFASTAIEAMKWGRKNKNYDYPEYELDNIEHKIEVWFDLQKDVYNIDMVALVLEYEMQEDGANIKNIKGYAKSL